MRERLDCAVLLTRCTFNWVEPLLGQHGGGRLHLHGFGELIDTGNGDAHTLLAAASMALRRHDACLVPVAPASLSWARTSLAHAIPHLRTPVMALVRGLTTLGLYDLYRLGVADFLRDPFCGHEARIRIERLLDDRRRAARVASNMGVAAPAFSYYALNDPGLEQTDLEGSTEESRELEAYARAAASRCSTSQESLKDAKSRVIEYFERAYINAALSRHAGNIAMASRAAQKHRRAFWALMRKYEIDAEPFRQQDAASRFSRPKPRP